MDNLTKEIKTHKVIWEDATKKPLYLTTIRYKRLVSQLTDAKKANSFICDSEGFGMFKKKDIKSIVPLDKHDINRYNTYRIKNKFDQFTEQKKAEEEEKFVNNLEKFADMTPEEKTEYAKKNPCQSFQFEFILKNPISTKRERNKAFTMFIKRNKNLMAPSFLKKQ